MAFGGEESSLSIVVRLRNEASKELDKFRSHVEKMQPAFQKMALVGTASLGAIGGAIAITTKAYQGQERAEARLEQIARKVTGANDEQIASFKKLASELQSIGVVGDEVLISGQSQLASFTKSSDVVSILSKDLADLAVASYGVNVSQEQSIQTANLLGKALQGQLGALTRTGILVSGEYEKAFNEANSETERAIILSKIVQDNYGGLNVAMRATSEGGMQALKNSWGDLLEIIGQQFVPILNRAVEAIAPFIARASEWMQENGKLAVQIVGVVAAVSALLVVFGTLGMLLPAIITGISLLLSPVGLIIAALMVGLIPAIKFVRENFDGLKQKALELWNAFRNINILDRLREGFFQLRDTAMALWTTFKQSIIVDALRFAFEQLHMAFVHSVLPAIKNLWELFQVLRPILEPLSKIIIAVVVVAFVALVSIASILIRVLAQIIEVATSVALVIAKVLTPPIKFVVDLFKSLVDWVSQAIEKLNLFDKAKKVVNAVSGFFTKDKRESFETGGRVPGPEGMPVPIIAHGQETIIPARKSGSGTGTTISLTINNPTIRNEADLYSMKSQLDSTLRGIIRDNKLSIAS